MATIFSEGFETDGNGTRYTTSIAEFTDGSGDFFTRTDGSNIGSFYAVSGQEGSFYFAAMDINGEGAASQQTLTFSGINISGFTNLNFSTLLAEDDDGTNQDWDISDFVLFEYQIDGGGYNNLLAIESIPDGDNFNAVPAQDTNFDGDGDGTQVTSTFASFSNAIAGTGSTLDLRVTIDLDAGDEDIAIDSIEITGDSGSPSTPEVNLSVTPTSGSEAGTTAITVTATASSAVTGDQTVNLALSGTADASDFTGTIPTTLTILDGQTTATFTVNVNDDILDEGSETATFTISSPSAGVVLGSTVTGNVDITDNDGSTTPTSTVAINEIRIDQPSNDDDEYFELFGTPGDSLGNLTYLVIGDGTGGSGVIEAVVDLTGQSIPASGFFTAAESTFSIGTADFTTTLNFENNDNVTHLLVEGFTGSNGDDLDTDDDGVLDTTPWTSIVDSVALIKTSGSGDEVYSTTLIGPNGSFVPAHVFRSPDGTGSWNIGQFNPSGGDDTPGATNVTGGGTTIPGITKIHEIQGSGSASALDGNIVTIEGIVISDNQGGSGTGLSGFFVQEEDADADGNSLTSEGIFIFDGSTPAVDVNVGDLVQVTGEVEEFNDLTELTNITSVNIVSSGNALPSATDVNFPLTAVSDLESYEGMLINAKATINNLTVTEHFNLDRFGEVLLSSNGRLEQFTQNNLPDVAGYTTHLDDIAKRSILIDDGRNGQNLIPIPNARRGNNLSPTNTLRGGDTVSSVTGALHYAFGEYRVQPTETIRYFANNPRPTTTPAVDGNIKVASFNLLNYFNGDGAGGGFPTSRGANSFADFEYQTDKLVAALSKLDADIIGVQELENDYADGASSAAQDLVDALNAVATGRNYAYVTPPTGNLGSDEIAVGIIYDQNVVTEVGTAAELDTVGIFDGTDTNRTPIAQTFQVDAGNPDAGAKFTIAVNHFKSKGGTGTRTNADAGDGQGNWNQMRTDAANAVQTWLAGNPTGDADSDILVIGDINAYQQEDPVKAFENNGYTNLVTGDYSFVFDGQWGSLDHAFANTDLAPQVTGGATWHINADEPDALDYSTRFNDSSLRARDEFRASDHDPLLIGLDLGLINLDGTPARDTLIGTDVDEIITGFQGGDNLTGGGGSDIFTYTSIRDAGDTIADFTIADADQIDLSQLFTSLGISTTYASAISDGYLSFTAVGSDSLIRIDPDGTAAAGRATPFAIVTGVSNANLDNSSNFVI